MFISVNQGQNQLVKLGALQTVQPISSSLLHKMGSSEQYTKTLNFFFLSIPRMLYIILLDREVKFPHQQLILTLSN